MKSRPQYLLMLLGVAVIHASPQVASNDTEGLISDTATAVAIVDAIDRHDFVMADSLIGIKLRIEPTSLQWHFLRGMRYYADLFVFPSFDEQALSKMEQSLNEVIERGEQVLENDENNEAALFYAGGAYGYLGIASAARGSLFSGVRSAKKGFDLQERLIELYPECNDAYLGPGMMNLMTSAVPLFLKPILYLFGLSGTEDKAFEYLTIAYSKGILVRTEAGIYLAQLYERRKEFEKASALYGDLVARYPMRVGLCAEAASPLWAQHKYDAIVAMSLNTINLFNRPDNRPSRGDSAWLPSVFSNCARAYELRGDTSSSIAILNRFLSDTSYGQRSSWRIHLHLGDLLIARQDTIRAISHFRNVINSDAPEKIKDRTQDLLETISKPQ